MSHAKKPDLRDKAGPRTTVTDTDVTLASAAPKSVIPPSGEPLRRPDTHVPEGQTIKG